MARGIREQSNRRDAVDKVWTANARGRSCAKKIESGATGGTPLSEYAEEEGITPRPGDEPGGEVRLRVRKEPGVSGSVPGKISSPLIFLLKLRRSLKVS
jgi:hypothetical protein